MNIYLIFGCLYIVLSYVVVLIYTYFHLRDEYKSSQKQIYATIPQIEQNMLREVEYSIKPLIFAPFLLPIGVILVVVNTIMEIDSSMDKTTNWFAKKIYTKFYKNVAENHKINLL